MECLITNEICSNCNKKCKDCKLDDCRNTLLLLEEEEKMWINTKDDIFKKKLNRQYPECSNCPYLEKRSDNKVYCFYRCKDKCILK